MNIIINILLAISAMTFGFGAQAVFAESGQNAQYIPLIGITSVPEPATLPAGGGNVTYRYAVKNFLAEYPLTGVEVTDDKCSPVQFVEGDDNGDSKLDQSETWRYVCASTVSATTQNIAVAGGASNNIPATAEAQSTVVVGSDLAPPQISIVNATKVPYPLSLPPEGTSVDFTYRVINPGLVPLSDVAVLNDKCGIISGKLGDRNGNGLLDADEVWIYTCTASLNQTTTITTTVKAFANGLEAVGVTEMTIRADTPGSGPANLFDVSISPLGAGNSNFKIIVWTILAGILIALIILYSMTGRRKKR